LTKTWEIRIAEGSTERNATVRNRRDSALAERLVDAAEELFGQHGLEAVSLRQVSLAAGTGNNYAVQYHFGDLQGLIGAILSRRSPQVEAVRAGLLAQAQASGRLDPRTLMDILYRPLIQFRNARGKRAFARFVLALQISPMAPHFVRPSFYELPVVDQALQLLDEALPDLPPALMRERQRLIAIMVLTSVFNRWPPYQDERLDEALVDNAIDMATAALIAPAAPAVRAMAEGMVPPV
jgi:AcrR family transcriptional regulator